MLGDVVVFLTTVGCVIGLSPETIDQLTPNAMFHEACGYDSCPEPMAGKGGINVHIVPHAHWELGNDLNFRQHFTGENILANQPKIMMNVKRALDYIVTELSEHTLSRFALSDIAYFFEWWKARDITVRRMVYKLMRTGRLTFLGGGWSMSDEASTSYHALIESFTYTLRKINATLLECGRPLVAWQAHVMGHSREFASLVAQMGFDGLFINPISYDDELARMRRMALEMLWRGSDDLGPSSDIFTHVLYDGYWAPPGFCFGEQCSPSHNPRMRHSDPAFSNAEERAKQFVEMIYNRQWPNYNSSHVMVMMGMMNGYWDAPVWFRNIEVLMDTVNGLDPAPNRPLVYTMYSSPHCYLKYVRQENPPLELKQDDFFPIAPDRYSVIIGHYASSPSLKLLMREGLIFLQMAKQMQVLAKLEKSNSAVFEELMWILGVFQDHTILTGYARDAVKSYYVQKMFVAIQKSVHILKQAFNKIRGSPSTVHYYRCSFNESKCFSQKAKTYVVHLYNPLAWSVRVPVRLPVMHLGDEVVVSDSKGNVIDSAVIGIPEFVMRNRNSSLDSEIVFLAHVPALGFTSYCIERVFKNLRKKRSRAAKLDRGRGMVLKNWRRNQTVGKHHIIRQINPHEDWHILNDIYDEGNDYAETANATYEGYDKYEENTRELADDTETESVKNLDSKNFEAKKLSSEPGDEAVLDNNDETVLKTAQRGNKDVVRNPERRNDSAPHLKDNVENFGNLEDILDEENVEKSTITQLKNEEIQTKKKFATNAHSLPPQTSFVDEGVKYMNANKFLSEKHHAKDKNASNTRDIHRGPLINYNNINENDRLLAAINEIAGETNINNRNSEDNKKTSTDAFMDLNGTYLRDVFENKLLPPEKARGTSEEDKTNIDKTFGVYDSNGVEQYYKRKYIGFNQKDSIVQIKSNLKADVEDKVNLDKTFVIDDINRVEKPNQRKNVVFIEKDSNDEGQSNLKSNVEDRLSLDKEEEDKVNSDKNFSVYDSDGVKNSYQPKSDTIDSNNERKQNLKSDVESKKEEMSKPLTESTVEKKKLSENNPEFEYVDADDIRAFTDQKNFMSDIEYKNGQFLPLLLETKADSDNPANKINQNKGFKAASIDVQKDFDLALKQHSEVRTGKNKTVKFPIEALEDKEEPKTVVSEIDEGSTTKMENLVPQQEIQTNSNVSNNLSEVYTPRRTTTITAHPTREMNIELVTRTTERTLFKPSQQVFQFRRMFPEAEKIQIARKKITSPKPKDIFIKNEYIRVNINPKTHKVSDIELSNGVKMKLDIQFYYYASDDPDVLKTNNARPDSLLFRPMESNPIPVLDYMSTKVVSTKVVEEIHCEYSKWASLVVRLYKESAVIEVNWAIGPIPDYDHIGKEVFIRYQTDLLNDGAFYTDSNGRQTIKRLRNVKPMYEGLNTNVVGANYYPVTSKIYIEDRVKKLRFAVLPDRAQGGSSLYDGELDLMIARRIFANDADGNGIIVNETTWVRGTHYLYLSKSDYNPNKIFEKKFAKELELKPQIFLLDPTGLTKEKWMVHNNEISFIETKLPIGVHLLTLEQWNHGTILLRFENYLEKSDTKIGNTKVIYIKDLFSNIIIEKVEETMLAGNILKKNYSPLNWLKKEEFVENFNAFYGGDMSPKFDKRHYDHREYANVDVTKGITLRPQEIRTFVCFFSYAEFYVAPPSK